MIPRPYALLAGANLSLPTPLPILFQSHLGPKR
jgi:hypothetical protein